MGEALGVAGSKAMAENGDFETLNATLEKSIGLHEKLAETNGDLLIRKSEESLFHESPNDPNNFFTKFIAMGAGNIGNLVS